ncbi:hypothetical protein AGMMS49982_21550 [Bacteroidia bacterium]|nr:hypothetical protein AGMMS49982_21550 [Bacteroidia bacterium]
MLFYLVIDNKSIIFAPSFRKELYMIDDEELKARVDKLMENLNYYLRNYNRLITIGYRKSVLDPEIESLERELKALSRRL